MAKIHMTSALKTILALTYPEYRGRKYNVQYVRAVTLWDRDWSGGTHSDYAVLRDVSNGIERAGVPAFRPSDASTPTIDLPVGYVVVKHAYFCGHDTGITIYVNPDGPTIRGLPGAALPALPCNV